MCGRVGNVFPLFQEQENLADAEEQNEQLVKAKQDLEGQVMNYTILEILSIYSIYSLSLSTCALFGCVRTTNVLLKVLELGK